MVVRSEAEGIASRPIEAARVANRGIPWIRAGAGLALVTGAYYYSLATLVRGLGLDTPLGYLGLVPLISLILMATRALAPHAELDIHDRYSDYIIGVSLLMAALGTLVIVPIRLSTFYWQWRFDLLSLPFFVGGTISIVFGLRALWRVRLGVLFLFLAWPLPYIVLINGQLQAFTNLTLGLVRGILRVVPLAQPLASSDGSLFWVPASGSAFAVSVSSAGSGLNGMVGFLLVAAAFASLVRGRLLAKVAWLASGLSLIWVLDIARILTIFTAGHTFGERFALQVLHPAMAIVFNLGVLGMIALLPLFKLHLGALSSAGARPAPRSRPAVKHARVALIIVGAAALVTAAADTRPLHTQLLAGDLRPPRLQAFHATSVHVVGWKNEAGCRFSHCGILESSRVDLGGGVIGHVMVSGTSGSPTEIGRRSSG
jgi:exosortase/archaeosortase family protein